MKDTDARPPATGVAPVTHDALRRRQEALLRRLVDLLAAEPPVLGLAAGGSYARGATDGFSDLDLHCYLRDEARTGREGVHARVAALAPTLSVLYLYDREGLYLYRDGVRLDLTYEAPSAVPRHHWRRPQGEPGRRILLDPEGVLARAREAGTAPTPQHRAHPRFWQPGDPAYATWFLWMFRQIYGWTKRGAQGGGRALSKLASAADSVHQVRTSLTELRLWTLDQPYNLASADPDLAVALAGTYPPLEPGELLAATRALLVAYERVCPDYCRKAGIPYPAEEVVALRRVLHEFDRLR
jgi:hypothetical protein